MICRKQTQNREKKCCKNNCFSNVSTIHKFGLGENRIFVGPPGRKGETGPIGPAGLQGATGPTGPAGSVGPTGPIGPAGIADKIEVGDIFFTSSPDKCKIVDRTGSPNHVLDFVLLKGEKGERGEKGETGNAGPQGERGEKGERGATGVQGERGEKGERGEQGERGEAGPQGARGEAEKLEIEKIEMIDPAQPAEVVDNFADNTHKFQLKIPRGEKGERGERGERGEEGPQGLQGPAGENGKAGEKGENGLPGEDGRGIRSSKLIPKMTTQAGSYYELQFTLSDNSVISAGQMLAPLGPQGDEGEPGPPGEPAIRVVAYFISLTPATQEDLRFSLKLDQGNQDEISYVTNTNSVKLKRGYYIINYGVNVEANAAILPKIWLELDNSKQEMTEREGNTSGKSFLGGATFIRVDNDEATLSFAVTKAKDITYSNAFLLFQYI